MSFYTLCESPCREAVRPERRMIKSWFLGAFREGYMHFMWYLCGEFME